MGMVKTAHKEYPLAYLQSWGKGQEDEAVPARGDFCLLETQAENGIPFYALGWADKKMKTIVSNVGSTLSEHLLAIVTGKHTHYRWSICLVYFVNKNANEQCPCSTCIIESSIQFSNLRYMDIAPWVQRKELELDNFGPSSKGPVECTI